MGEAPQIHSTLRALVAAHGLQEVMRVLGVVATVDLKDRDAAAHIGRARQAIHVRAPT